MRVVLAVLVESPTAPRMFMESFRSFLHFIPVNQVRDRYLSSNCHKRVNLLQIVLRVGGSSEIKNDDLLRRCACSLLSLRLGQRAREVGTVGPA